MRDLLRQMFLDALRELDLPSRMKQRVWAKGSVLEIAGDLYALDQVSRLRLVAVGKAAVQMAATVDELLGAGRATGIVVAPLPGVSRSGQLPNFRYFTGGHPYPDAGSLEGAAAALELLRGCEAQALVLFLLSGGGSALFEKPLFDDITLEDLAGFNRVLVTCGANIYEMNVLRKHFSAVKGGRLALAAFPAQQVTLYVSDVPADKPSTVASGPTMADESTVADCLAVVERYSLLANLPEPYRRRLASKAAALEEIPETPKPNDRRLQRSRSYAVLSNADGVDALLQRARTQGWEIEADLSCDDWPLEKAADYLLQKLRDMRARAARPACLISGGELSCPVTGSGLGGRNQAFALYCAQRIAGEGLTVLSAGTDGIDGNSPAAGAAADGATIERARSAGLDAEAAFANSDSYTFFDALGDTIVTGPTGNNVRDLRILLAA